MKTKVNKAPLLIGITLVVLSELALFLIPEVDLNNASFYEAYQQLSAEKFWNWMALLGWNICIIWVIVFFVRKRRQHSKCKSCGALIKNKDDIFCRECGEKI